MSKRKRPSPEDLPSKIHHARKLLTKALKTAKAFEQRKLLRKEDGAEVLLLKAVDLPELAAHHINKKLKIKSEFATNNVTARLLNTKPVKEAMKDISALLGLEVSKDKPPAIPPVKTVDTGQDNHTSHDTNGDPGSQKDGDRLSPPLFNTAEARGLSPESEVDLNAEDSSDSEMIRRHRPPGHKKQRLEAKGKPEIQAAQGTTFLPSLTMGGYWSGSESAEDIEEAPRKNRRGQRARQKIWEQKYGAKANHVKSQETLQRYTQPRERLPPRAPVEKVVEDDRPIHPSWEAAKRAKEQKQAQFQGKKVVFD